MSSSSIIQCKQITKSYGRLKILKGIDLDIANREIVSIVGKSGAGKSTLLHILGTLDKMDSGQLIIDQHPIERLSDNELADFRNRHIGFIFQFHYLLQEFSAIENVAIPGFIANKKTSVVEKRAKELLELLGLGDRLEHKPNELSGGEQQRVAVARALINQPKVIFADEPTGNLDSQNSEELYRLFFDLRDSFGHCFVIVTHNEHFASLSDRVLQMEDGKVLNKDE